MWKDRTGFLVSFDNYFSSVVLFYSHCWVMSPSASGRFYLQMSRREYYSSFFWFGFIREAFNSLVCVAVSLCLTRLFITMVVTVGFWCLFCICHAICDFSEAHSLVSFDTVSASCIGCNFSSDIEIKMIEVNSLLKFEHLLENQCFVTKAQFS